MTPLPAQKRSTAFDIVTSSLQAEHAPLNVDQVPMIFHKSQETGVLTYVVEVQVKEPVMMLNGFVES